MALSTTALKKARGVTTHPYELTRKYGEPVLYTSEADVRTAIRRDLSQLEDLGKHWGDALNRDAIEAARAQLGQWFAGRLHIEFVVDRHTGTKYSVTVQDRRAR